jgi:hypothetical protein
MKKRRRDPWDRPWVTIAAIVGVVAVLVIALLYFSGLGSGWISALPPPEVVPASQTSSPVTPTPTAPQGTAVVTIIISEVTPVSVPDQGVFVRVSYIGGFTGTYGVDGVLETVRDSGDRLYAVETHGGNVSAAFRKEDGSARHELVVEIWKNGKAVKSGKSAQPYGEVSISYKV